jgi:hypothetical protein
MIGGAWGRFRRSNVARTLLRSSYFMVGLPEDPPTSLTDPKRTDSPRGTPKKAAAAP